MNEGFTGGELEAYLEEALSRQEMAAVEARLRVDQELTRQLAGIDARRDAGVHTLGEVWRRHRVSCPPREQLGSYLLGALPAEHSEYVTFHIDKVGCRVCLANLDDLKRRRDEEDAVVVTRRTKYFQSSAGYLNVDQ